MLLGLLATRFRAEERSCLLCNIEILVIILNAPSYVNNHRIHEDLQMNTVLSEIKKSGIPYT
jgi:hypothetical protein